MITAKRKQLRPNTHLLVFISCIALLCFGCASPSKPDTVSLIYANADSELLPLYEMYGITEGDLDIAAIHYGNYIDSSNTALVVLEVSNAEISAEMADMGDSLKIFAVMDKELSRLESPAFSVVADSIEYSILRFPSSDAEHLFINAIDIAAGPEEFTGGLYHIGTWENLFPAELCSDPDFLPILIGDKLYLSSISEADMEQRVFFQFDSESNSLKLYDPAQDKYL